MKKLFFALVALCTMILFVPSCDNPNSPSYHSGKGKKFEVKGVTFKMIEVKGGTFTMGTIPNEEPVTPTSQNNPEHSVSVSDFFIGETEVTQELWEAVMGDNPSLDKTDNQKPVEQVSWDDCQKFIERLNIFCDDKLGKKRFRLPTEAEWEYAARGGKKSAGYIYSGSNIPSEVAWYQDPQDKNSISGTYPVASLKPNELGIYDMSGNVWEWCYDWYHDWYYYQSPNNNPQGPSSGYCRVCRGGSGIDRGCVGCLCTTRGYCQPESRRFDLGLRIVLSE